MSGIVFKMLIIALALFAALLGTLILMAIRAKVRGGKHAVLFTAIGIAAALDFMLLGVLVPKAILEREDDRYLATEWKRDVGGSSQEEPKATEEPLPGVGHEIDIMWLWEALRLVEDEDELVPREPLSFEMSMEQAALTARNELDLLSSLGALTGLDKDGLHFKSGELRGYQPGLFEGELGSPSGMPRGLWIITFEDDAGRPVEVKCDSRNGFVYSAAFRRDAEVSDFICFSSLIGYAKYLGLPIEGAMLDAYGAGTYVITAGGVPLVYNDADSRGMTCVHIFDPAGQTIAVPTPLPTGEPEHYD